MNLIILAIVAASTASSAIDQLEAKVKSLASAHDGLVTVMVKHVDTQATVKLDADRPMPTASLIKFPIMVEAYRQAAAGKISLDTLIALREEDKVPGSGILTPHFSAGTKISLRDAVRLMIVYSDNTATNLVLDQVGIHAVCNTMEQLGLANTKIHSKVFRRDTSKFPERSKEFGLGSTTAAETVQLYELLASGNLGDEAQTEAMLSHLYACDDRSKLAALLPAGTKIAHKGGAVSSVRCDGGIIDSPTGKIIVCVMTAENKDRSWATDNAAQQLCAKIARAAFDHFNPTATALRPQCRQS